MILKTYASILFSDYKLYQTCVTFFLNITSYLDISFINTNDDVHFINCIIYLHNNFIFKSCPSFFVKLTTCIMKTLTLIQFFFHFYSDVIFETQQTLRIHLIW